MKTIFSSRKAQSLARVSILLLTAALIAGMIGCDGDGYTPPSKDLEIQDWYDLDDVRDNPAGHHILMNDLDSTTAGYDELASPTANQGKGWEPIGTEYEFIGSFDGQGHEIHDLFIDRPEEWWIHVGLFYSVGDKGSIKDIGVVNATVTGESHTGGLVGSSSGTVSNSYFTGSVTGTGFVGGLVGWSRGIVSNSYSIASVTGERSVGGLVGINQGGTVSNSYFTGSVTGELAVGGLVGDHSGAISNSYYNYDEVLINGDNIITTGALFDEDFEQWLANDKFLDFNERLSLEDGYYLVNNVTDFKELLAFGQNTSLKFRLKNDLDLGDDPNFYVPCLAGEFDGNDHKISNLSFNFDFVCHVGLFGYLAPGGKVTQVGVENVNITGTSFVGGLVGANYQGTVSNCYATGSVTGSATRPELGGYEEYVGGLVGSNLFGTVSNSYFTGSVTGNDEVGGLVGGNYGTVSDCYATGSVVGNDEVGGLVGGNNGNVNNSYSTGNVTGNWDVGGLVGTQLLGTVSNCHFTGNVVGVEWVGGLVGWNGGNVNNSYSTGTVTGSESVGGLIGWNCEGTLSNSYSTGHVQGDERIGGLVGLNEEGTVNNSFWDTETSGQATSDGGMGKTTAEMQDIATFSGAGWKIIAVADPGTHNPSYIWNIVNNVTYPFLSWEA